MKVSQNPGVMSRAGSIIDSRTALIVFTRGFVAGFRYCSETLVGHVRLIRGDVGPSFDFMRPQKTVRVPETLEGKDIQRTDLSV